MHRVDFRGFPNLPACPSWWVNFVETHQEQTASWSRETLYAELEKNDVSVVTGPIDKDIDYIEFETEEDYLAFKLKWL